MITLGETQIKWGLLGFGALTLTMAAAVIAPGAVLQATFGAAVQDPLGLLITRSWGALVALMGAALLYGAVRPNERRALVGLVLISKVVFLALLMSQGRAYLGAATGTVIIDTLAVVFLAVCLMHPRQSKA